MRSQRPPLRQRQVTMVAVTSGCAKKVRQCVRISSVLMVAVMLSAFAAAHARAAAPAVTHMRVPDRGVQPQLAVDEGGAVHLIYLKGDPARSDIFYTRSKDGGAKWSRSEEHTSELQ